MKLIIFAALLVAASVVPSGPIVQAQHKGPGNPNDLINLPESGRPGVDATAGPNFRNLANAPLSSREELDLVRPNEALLPPPEIRPVPAKPLPPALTTR